MQINFSNKPPGPPGRGPPGRGPPGGPGRSRPGHFDMNWSENVSDYQIEIFNRENGIFWAGETVEGVVKLTTNKDIKCRAVKIKLDCSSHVHWHRDRPQGPREPGEAPEDNREDFYGDRAYMESRFTVFGNFHQTGILNGAGADAHWDISTGMGDMPIELTEDPDTVTLAVRVMDYDWGMKDDFIGEVLVHVRDLLENPGELKSFPLRSKGKESKGEVTLSATVNTHSSGAKILIMRAHQATGLKSADLFGKNDVYVQCYKVPSNTSPDEKLPLFEKEVILPPGTYSYPFSFKLPIENMPSSFEGGFHDGAQVRWSLYSNIDIPWQMDPSTRHMITVISADLPPLDLFSPVIRGPADPIPIYGCACCGCCLKGTAQFTAAIDTQCGAPGDMVRVSLEAFNNTADMRARLSVKLILLARLSTSPKRFGSTMHNRGFREWEIASEELPAQKKVSWPSTDPKLFTIPACPPSFSGKKGNTKWTDFDPMTWKYVIEIKLEMLSNGATNIVWQAPFHVSNLPSAKLNELNPGSVVTKEPVVHEGDVGETSNTLTISAEDVQIVPIDSPLLQAYILENSMKYDKPAVFHSDNPEDMNNCGAPLSYTVAYPSPSEPSPFLCEMPTVAAMVVPDTVTLVESQSPGTSAQMER